MTLKKYIILMLLSTLLSWGAFLIVLFRVNPAQAGFLGFLLFYLSLLFALTGTLSLLGLLLRVLILRGELIFRQVSIAFRQAISFSFLVVGALFLQSKNLLTWWNIALLILALTVLEFFYISYKRRT